MKTFLLLSLFILDGLIGCSQSLPVSFTSGAYTLNGTLTIPVGVGPFPLVVFVHGSGPNDRDQTLHLTGGNAQCLYPGLYNDTIRNFKDLAEEFQNNGVAVLRYDKRSFTYGAQLDLLNLSPNHFIADVHAAIDFVKMRPEIDSNCMSLLGHSQGASFIPIIANSRSDIQSLIGLGTPVTRVDSLYAAQFRDLYYFCLNDTPTGDAYYQSTLADFAKIRNGTWGNNNIYLGAYPKFWNDWMDIGEATITEFQKTKMPVLIVHGMNDFNVPLTDAHKLENGLTQADKNVVYLSGINHYLTTASNPLVAPSVYNEILSFLSINGCKTTHVSEAERVHVFTTRQIGSQLLVRLNSGNSEGSLLVYDLLGRVCFSRKLNANNEVRVDLNRFPSGLYGVNVRINGHTETQRIWVP